MNTALAFRQNRRIITWVLHYGQHYGEILIALIVVYHIPKALEMKSINDDIKCKYIFSWRIEITSWKMGGLILQ